MPLIHIELIEGRTQEQLKNLVADVTDAVTKNTGAPAEHVKPGRRSAAFSLYMTNSASGKEECSWQIQLK